MACTLIWIAVDTYFRKAHCTWFYLIVFCFGFRLAHASVWGGRKSCRGEFRASLRKGMAWHTRVPLIPRSHPCSRWHTRTRYGVAVKSKSKLKPFVMKGKEMIYGYHYFIGIVLVACADWLCTLTDCQEGGCLWPTNIHFTDRRFYDLPIHYDIPVHW